VKPDHPELGLVRPPVVYLASLATGAVLEFAMPLPFLRGALNAALGASVVVFAIALFGYSVAKFRAAGTPVPARKPTIAIVRTGPYRVSRNPIYLAFSLVQLGVALWANSFWLIATLVVAIGLISFMVIPREERYLEEKFGAEYLAYKADVRRWL
jgi:protein-S-isoprenylcysteine O-methyltransferase Ste14